MPPLDAVIRPKDRLNRTRRYLWINLKTPLRLDQELGTQSTVSTQLPLDKSENLSQVRPRAWLRPEKLNKQYVRSSGNPNVLIINSFHVTSSSLLVSRSLNIASTSSSTSHFFILCRTQISNSASSTKPSLLISILGTSNLESRDPSIGM